MKRLALLFVSLCLMAPTAQANGDVQSQITAIVEATLDRPVVTGITIAAGKSGEVVFAKGFGFANIETGEPVNTATKMRAGSVSKVFTTALIGKLLEQGKLDLDTPVQTYVPNFPQKRWPVTVRQMAGHLSGIRHYRGNEFASTKHYATVGEGLAIFANDPLEYEPNTNSSYSSYAWNLISAALEGTGSTPFLEMMHSQVFAALNMHETQAEDVTKPIPNIATFHETNGSRTTVAPFVDNSYKWAGGGFVGTASDMARFGLAHLKPGYLKAETLAVLTSEQKTRSGEATGFGIGWMTAGNMDRRVERAGMTELSSNYSEKLMWHSGGSMGAVALLLVDPAEESVVALMANNSRSFPTLQEIALKTLGILKHK